MMLWYRLKHLKSANHAGVNKYALNFAWLSIPPKRRYVAPAPGRGALIPNTFEGFVPDEPAITTPEGECNCALLAMRAGNIVTPNGSNDNISAASSK